MRKVNCVFEGGGIKGISFVGALKYLEESKIEIDKVAGTSVGALFATLIAVGYTAKELEEIVYTYDFEKLKGSNMYNKVPVFGKAISLLKNKGFYTTNDLERFVEDLLLKKSIITFKDLPKDKLKIVAADVTKKEIIIFPNDLEKYGLDSSFSVAKAVAMSCTIPIFYEPFKINNSLIVDGGVVSNYPLWIFEEESTQTIGFLIKEKNNKNANNNIINYVTSIISTFSNKEDIITEHNKNKKNTCFIEENDILATDFKIELSTKRMLIEKGYKQAKNFINSLT